jgi:hypothetical protein
MCMADMSKYFASFDKYIVLTQKEYTCIYIAYTIVKLIWNKIHEDRLT